MVPVTEHVCNRLYLLFPVAIFVTILVTVVTVYTVKNYMDVHVVSVVMDGKYIVVVFQEFLTEFPAYLISSLCVTFSGTE